MQGVQVLSLQTRWSSRARRHPKALTSAACGMEAWKTKSTAQTPWTRSPAPLAPKAGHLHPARVLTSAGFRRSHRLVLCRGLRRAVAWNRVIPIPFLVQGLRVGRRNHHSMRATHGTRRCCASCGMPSCRGSGRQCQDHHETGSKLQASSNQGPCEARQYTTSLFLEPSRR